MRRRCRSGSALDGPGGSTRGPAPGAGHLHGLPAREDNLAVLIEVLVTLGEHADPRADTALLAHAGHPEPRVRGAVARGVGTWCESPAFRDEVSEAPLVLITDMDPGSTAQHLPHHRRRQGPRCRPRQVRIAAVHGLALHHDKRCVEAARRLGQPQPVIPSEEHYLASAWRYERRRDHC